MVQMDPFVEFELPAPAPDEHEDLGDLYKKWFRTKSVSGFVSLRPWWEALKISVDIGDVEVSTQKMKSHTLVWVDAILLTAWLRTPVRPDFVVYGGARVDGKPISRVFSITDDKSGGFYWKTEHFEARASSTGAFVPDPQKKLSSNQIKMRAGEHAEILLRAEMGLFGHAARNPRWFVTKPK